MNISNTNLLTALRLARTDRSKEPLFIEALYQAKFLCPVRLDTRNLPKNPDGSVVLDSDSPISLVSISDSSGALYLMAFSDRNELAKWKQENPQIILYSFDDYKAVLMSDDTPYRGVVLNPFSDNIVLGKEMFSDGNTPYRTARSNETVMIGQPANYPTEMVEQLRKFFRKNKTVKTAYLLWMARGQEAGFLLVLETGAAPQKLFPSIGELCKPYLQGNPLDMILLNSSLGKSAVENQQPFYRTY